MASDFRFNVYDAFERVHELVDSADMDDADGGTAMDRAEYQIQINKLVEGLVEILQHAARHSLLSLDAGDYDHDLEVEEIGVYRDEEDEPAANHHVAIRIPDYLLPDEDDAVSTAIKSFDLGTVETTADVALAAYARAAVLSNSNPDLTERLAEAWEQVAERLIPRVAPAVQRLESAGLIKVYDARTKRSYDPVSVAADEANSTIELTIATDAPEGARPA
jgi:hypothetical protein